MSRPLKILAAVAALGLGAFAVSALGAQAPEAGTDAPRVRVDPDRTVTRALPRTPRSHARPTERVRSQERGARSERRGRGRRGESFEALGLSDNQRAQIDAIRESSREQMRDLRAAGHPGRQSRRAVREESNALINDVLTPEQRQVRETAQAERAVERQNRRIERMGELLGLDDSQSARVRSIMEQSATDRAAAGRNGDDREAATSAVREATRAAMQNVLTPDQQAQMEELRAARSERRRGGQARGGQARDGEARGHEASGEAGSAEHTDAPR